MKRVVSFLLIVALLIPLSACGGADVTAEEAQSQQDVTTVLVEEPSAEPTATEAVPTPVPEVQIVDADWVSLKLTGMKEDDQGGYQITLFLKNELDSSITSNVLAFINGWAVPDDFIRFRLDQKSEETQELNIPAEFFQLCGIDTVNEVILQYSIYKSDYSDSIQDTVTIYPAGEEAAKSAAAYQYEPKDEDVTLFDNEGVKVVFAGFLPDDPNGYGVLYYVENMGDEEVRFDLFNGGVNAYSYNDLNYNSPLLPVGTRLMLLRNFSAKDMEEDGVGEITQIDFSYRLSVKNGPLDEVVIEEARTFYPSGMETPRVERTPVEGEVVLVDNADFTIIVTACLDKPNSYRYGLQFYTENKTDKDISIEVQNAEVNGEACMSNSKISSLPAGMRTNTLYTWNKDAFEKAGLTDETIVEKLTLPIYIFSDGNRKSGDEVYKHTFKVKVW